MQKRDQPRNIPPVAKFLSSRHDVEREAYKGLVKERSCGAGRGWPQGGVGEGGREGGYMGRRKQGVGTQTHIYHTLAARPLYHIFLRVASIVSAVVALGLPEALDHFLTAMHLQGDTERGGVVFFHGSGCR